MSEFASKEQFIAANRNTKRRYRPVNLPVCGLKVRIQSMMEEELTSYQATFMRRDGRGMIPSKVKAATRALFVRCMVDGNGDRMFSLDDVDADFFRNMDTKDSGILYTECKDHCGLDDSDVGVSEGSEKNSEKTSADVSQSG